METNAPVSSLSTISEASPEIPVRNAFLSPPRRRERRNPSVTPRRFARFFGTPAGQSSSQLGFEGGYSQGSRLVLGDVDGSAMNSQAGPVKRKLFGNDDSASTLSLPPPGPLTKRTRTDQ